MLDIGVSPSVGRNMKYALLILTFCGFLPIVAAGEPAEIVFGEHDLVFDSLAKSWDEAIPLGNGVVGSLVWQKNDNYGAVQKAFDTPYDQS